MSLMIFEWREDEEFGGYGWIAKGYPNFNITAPGNFGHDCIEHFPRGLQRGPAIDELLALGARWRIRVDGGWWWQQRFWMTPEESFGGELHTILRNVGHTNMELPAPRNTPEAFCADDILTEAVRIINSEYEQDISDGLERKLDVDSELIVNMGKWLQVGYAANEARFRGSSGYDVMELSLQLDEASKRYQHGEEGDCLYVRVHEKDMEFSIRQTTPYERF